MQRLPLRSEEKEGVINGGQVAVSVARRQTLPCARAWRNRYGGSGRWRLRTSGGCGFSTICSHRYGCIPRSLKFLSALSFYTTPIMQCFYIQRNALGGLFFIFGRMTNVMLVCMAAHISRPSSSHYDSEYTPMIVAWADPRRHMND